MNEETAAANLAVIRTLMERSAVYRRALVPILFTAGTVAVLAAILGSLGRVETARAFFHYWSVVALVVLAMAFGLARRQASRDQEAFWSAPTRRIAQAMALPLFAGAILSCLLADRATEWGTNAMIGMWLLMYGCALHAAGFFAPRGMQVLGWVFALAGAGYVAAGSLGQARITPGIAHAIMALSFGGFHLAYAIYLKATGNGPADA